ncbi:MAG: FKBP-type peptidyl-prolyl cis-trans isomerase [Agathobacter sp.]|nr:FKBP-type peptidyl-prolyl cis-trans isomerase [Agathobacter sp.]
MKKRLLAVLLCAVMALSLGACGDSNKDDTQKDSNKDVKQPSITTLADYKDFATILTGDYEVTDEKVKAYFSNVVYSAGIGVMEVKDRDIVQKGDIVKTDYKGYLDGVAFDGGAATDQWIDVANNCGIDTSTGESAGGFIAGFTDGLVGAKVGEKTSHNVTFPDNYGNADLAGKETTFEFTVKAIYTEVTPETITDAMVAETFKKSYDVSTVADFMQIMKEEVAYNFLINYVIEKSTFDIPEEYLNYRLEEYQKLFTELYCTNIDIETYLSYYGTTLDAIKVQWAASLQSQIKAELVFEAIVKDAGLKVDEEELSDYVATIMTTAGTLEGNDFFAKEENIYKMLGVGNVAEGKAYFLNQEAVRDYVIENYQ